MREFVREFKSVLVWVNAVMIIILCMASGGQADSIRELKYTMLAQSELVLAQQEVILEHQNSLEQAHELIEELGYDLQG